LTVSGAGSLCIEDGGAQGNDAWLDASGVLHHASAGLITQDLDLVLLVRSTFYGGRGLDAGVAPGGTIVPATQGGVGAILNGPGTAALHGVFGIGGRGGDGQPAAEFGSDGGAGLAVAGTLCSLDAGEFYGGAEGDGNAATTQSGAAVQYAFSKVQVRGSLFVPGAVNGAGVKGPPQLVVNSVVTTSSEPTRTVTIESPVREFADTYIRVEGQPGDICWLFVSTGVHGTWMPQHAGVCSTDPALPVVTLPLGTIPSGGDFSVMTSVPALPVGIDGLVLYGQLAVAHGGTAILGSVSTVAWVSAAY
jgi:hypothetical protein